MKSKPAKLIITVLAITLLTFVQSFADTYYISTTGSDTTGTGTSGSPWATIQHAVNTAGAGDTVLVNNGTYTGFYSVNGGTLGSPVVIRANGSNVIINSRNDNTIDNVNIENTDYVTIEGFRSINSQRCGIRVATSRGVVVRNNVCASPTMWGVFTAFAPEVNVDSNTCYSAAQQHGIYVSNSDVANDNPIVRGNTCYGNYQNGIQLNGDLTSGGDGNIEGALIEKNIVHDNGWKGLSLISITGGTIRNNLIYNNGTRNSGAGGIHLAQEPGTGVLCENNIIVNNTVIEPVIGCIRITDGTTNTVFNNLCVGSSGISDDAGGNSVDGVSNIVRGSTTGLFINAGSADYRLASNSAAIDVGKAAYAGKSAPTTDILGNVRPSGSGFDAGAYEYQGASNNSPTATASGTPTSGAAPLVVAFTGSGTDSDGTIASYSWNFGDSGTSTQQNPSHTYNSAGNYTAVLTVTDDDGATGTDSVAITVTALQTYAISGYTRDGSAAAISGVTMTLSDGTSSATVTNASGYYNFGNLTALGSYTITPTKTGSTFSPVSISTNSLSANLTNRNFTGTINMYSISGYTRDGSAAAISGATMTLSGGTSSATVTNASGYYNFGNIAALGSYTIIPTKTGIIFAPVSISTNSLNSNLTNRNFTGSWVTIPNAPSALIATAQSTATASLSWTDNSNNETGFTVYRSSVSGSNYGQIGTKGPNITSYADSGLSQASTYYYVVIATNSAGGSGYSNEAFAVTFSILGLNPPTNLTAVVMSSVSVSLSWQDNSTIETGFKIERRLGVTGSYTQITTEGANVTSYKDNGLNAATTYFYRVRTYDTVTDSAYSNEVSAVTDPAPTGGVGGNDGNSDGGSANDVAIANKINSGEIIVIGSTQNRGAINPDQGDTAKIYFKGLGAGKYDCRIFSLTGELLWQDSKENVSSGTFQWIPKGIASGGYVVSVKGPGLNMKKKIAILR